MKRSRGASVLAAASLLAGLTMAGLDVPSAVASTGTTMLTGSASPAAEATPRVGTVAASSSIDFELSLAMRDAAGAKAVAAAVSTPGSASYRHYLTTAAFEQRFSPTSAEVAKASSWLKASGFSVGSVSGDRMSIDATGTAAQIEKAFSTSLSYHRISGRTERVADRALSVPASLAGIVSGAEGITETHATPDDTTGASPEGTIPQPGGFRVATPCSKYYGQKVNTTLPAYGHGYPATDPYVVCGYTPPQLRSAYGVPSDGGAGTTIAIVDAYDSPTVLADAQTYDKSVDPAHVLTDNQFSEITPAHGYNDEAECGASGWFGEQTLDVEAAHGLAPAANVVYVGAKNCVDGLYNAVQDVVDTHAADIITDSWGDNAGDLLDPASVRNAFDNTLIMAASTGITVLFSSGDDGDQFAATGLESPDYPPSSPYVTAVGGTSLKINDKGQRTAEYGWSTGRAYLCTALLVGALPGCTTATEGTWAAPALDGGSGGGTSYEYLQPAYQAGVVPTALATRNAAIFGPTPTRVEPDISADADPGTGFLVGETQTFPNGVFYDTYRIGGTSLASPVMAGIIADTDTIAGASVGFINPAIYGLYNSDPAALDDITSPGKQIAARTDFANGLSNSGGYLYSTRIITFEGKETYCDATGNCATRNVALNTTPGYDSMTGLGSPSASFTTALAGDS